MSWARLFSDGLIAIVPFSLVVWASFLWMPRMWLHALPADIQSRVPPKTAVERRMTGYVGPIVLLAFFGAPIALTWRLHHEVPGGLSYLASFAHLYGVWMIVNLWDLVGIDWPYAWIVDPAHPPIAGTENAPGWKDYAFHARAFAKASVFGLAIIVPAAAIIAAQ